MEKGMILYVTFQTENTNFSNKTYYYVLLDFRTSCIFAKSNLLT